MRGLSLAERCRRFMGKCTACQDYRQIISDWEIMAKDFQKENESLKRTIEELTKNWINTGSQPAEKR